MRINGFIIMLRILFQGLFVFLLVGIGGVGVLIQRQSMQRAELEALYELIQQENQQALSIQKTGLRAIACKQELLGWRTAEPWASVFLMKLAAWPSGLKLREFSLLRHPDLAPLQVETTSLGEVLTLFGSVSLGVDEVKEGSEDYEFPFFLERWKLGDEVTLRHDRVDGNAEAPEDETVLEDPTKGWNLNLKLPNEPLYKDPKFI